MRHVVVLISVFLAVGAISFGQAVQSRSSIPTITYIEGDVTIDGADAQVGDTVPAGALVATAARSLAEIEFSTRNVIKLAENTVLVFNPSNLQTGSELRAGALTLVLKNLIAGANGEGFRVRTPSAVAGVRGTSFFIKVESPTSTYVCACNGDVQVLDTDGSSLKEIAASHHKAVRIQAAVGSPQLADAPLLYHTDADMQQAAADVGYSIDWNVIDK